MLDLIIQHRAHLISVLQPIQIFGVGIIMIMIRVDANRLIKLRGTSMSHLRGRKTFI